MAFSTVGGVIERVWSLALLFDLGILFVFILCLVALS